MSALIYSDPKLDGPNTCYYYRVGKRSKLDLSLDQRFLSSSQCFRILESNRIRHTFSQYQTRKLFVCDTYRHYHDLEF